MTSCMVAERDPPSKNGDGTGFEWVPQELDGGVRTIGGSRLPTSGEAIAPCGPGACRLKGGYGALVDALANSLHDAFIHTGHRVEKIASLKQTYSTEQDWLLVTARKDGIAESVYFTAKRVVVAVPPAVAARIVYCPPLSDERLQVMRATETWAGNWCKVVASFKTPFWRNEGDSGVALWNWTGDYLLKCSWEEAGNCLACLNFGIAACERLNAHGSPDPVTGKSPPGLHGAVKEELSQYLEKISSTSSLSTSIINRGASIRLLGKNLIVGLGAKILGFCTEMSACGRLRWACIFAPQKQSRTMGTSMQLRGLRGANEVLEYRIEK